MIKQRNTKLTNTNHKICILRCKHLFFEKYIKPCESLKNCPNETISLSCSTYKE